MSPHDHDAPAGAAPRDSWAPFLRKCSPEELEEWHERGFISTLEYREALEENEFDPES
jgi:hypothetical protein